MLGDGSATIAINVGTTGGSAVTKFEYKVDGGPWVNAGSSSPITVTGLTNYVTSTVRVRAFNAAGAGTASLPLKVRPRRAGPTTLVAYSSGRFGIQVGFTTTRPSDMSYVGYTVRAYKKGTDWIESECLVRENGRGCYVGDLRSGVECDIRVEGYFTFVGSTDVRSTLESTTRTVRVNY